MERIQDGMFSYLSLEKRVPQDQPLRAVHKLTDTGVAYIEPGARRAVCGLWPTIDCAKGILRPLLLPAFYSMRSERLPVEQVDYNLPVPLVRRS